MNKLVKHIRNMTDEEILSLAMPRPGHPGEYGFMLNPRTFASPEACARVTHALLKRLSAVENMEGKMKKRYRLKY